ncbi:putative glyoxalase superfamily protein PhnB [Dyadobacter sp. BE34]|uniref:Glyoxalase superfamily protein PhnB n=1 Tax=Dyadobacter fermentans TaxID=94254 RepID=A0ABU1QZQ3_9BACT|nr:MULTISPECIES: VOC family protein [Dyadobacter]MDR6806636.1 putative glyoxalase superfamily protein PhnB [Dyadobacter fermentans]MDR7044378.1 putative glyoxalase superfamily protein PhnB [Dyadobacter sp. BE242]MDR7198688.1 putative glyoxalase superfamily protein PhnB [Dyadobacter sp. BE34]MDR7216650.1 putative glyoxalase superfamily protein PhnB [Dyadobacter sp. BE31]MDR7263824.1 putative glyoxalase superfamily protein PhnB [Dyadobacter sp. BE32]
MESKINQITPLLLVGDLERAITFYVEQLGFALTFRYEDFYAGIEMNGNVIHLKTDYKWTDKPERRNNDDIDLLFSVDNVEAVFEEISKKHIEIVQPLREMPYGKEFYIADPDGHVLAFVAAA